MNTVTEPSINHYLTEYHRVAGQLPGHQLPWLQQLKNDALTTFTQQGFPTNKQEDWKYTNITPLTKQHFQPHKQKINGALNSISIKQFLPITSTPFYCLVFIDGHFAPSLSTTTIDSASVPTNQSEGWRVGGVPVARSLRAQRGAAATGPRTTDRAATTTLTITNTAQALKENHPLIETHFNKIATQNTNAFKQLNTLFLQDGAFIHLPADTQLEQPIYLLFINTEATGMSASRNIIIAEQNTQAAIIENYVSLQPGPYFTNTVTELFLADNAHITHYKLIQENPQAFHIGTVDVQQQQHSAFTSHSFALGGLLIRSDTNTYLAAEQTACTLNGLYLADGRQHIDHHTCIKHDKPHGASQQYYKGILTDRARAVFNGKIEVAMGAYKTSAHQTNKNLILSPEAEIDTKPQLEIYADDVQCTHGAAVGQLDKEALFYLRARGIDEAQARNLLIYAFIKELFEKITWLPLREQLQSSLMNFLPAQLTLERVNEL